MAYVVAPAAPSSMDTMKAAALKMKAYNKTLRTESVIYDVFEKLAGEIRTDPKGMMVPDAIFLKTDTPPKGAHSQVIPLLKSLSGAPQLGTGENMLGNEENLQLKHLTVYYNEVKKSVASFGWGIDFNDLSYLDVYGQITPLMTRYFAELRGRRIREALLLTVAAELTKPPINLKHQFNPNVFVTNTDLGAMPKYNHNDLTEDTSPGITWPDGQALYDGSGNNYFVHNIYVALKAATNSWANPERANLTVQMILALAYYVENVLLLDPIMLGGQPSYIFLVPANTANYLSSFTKDGNITLGDVWKSVTTLTKDEQGIPAVLGRVSSLLLVADGRAPTITAGGDDVDPTLTPGFLAPGRAEGRNRAAFASNNKVFDVGFVLAKGGLVEWIANDLRYATEQTEYGKFQGKGAYQMSGIQLVKYDEDVTDATPTDTSYEQNGSCVVLMTPPKLVTTT